MYQNSVALPRLDLAGAIRSEDMSLSDYIAHLILPIFPVERQAANVPRVLITDDQVLSLKRGPKTAFQRFEGSLDSVGYSCQNAGIEEPMSAEDYNVLGQDRAEANATMRVTHAVLRSREDALAAATTGATGETLFTGQVTTASNAWSSASGTPIDDIGTMDEALTLRVGGGNRTLIIGRGVYTNLQKNAQIRTAYRNIVGINDKAAVNRNISLESLAMLFSVDKVLLGIGRKNTANKGAAATKAFIWPNNYALLIRGVDDPSNLTEPCLGRIFSWENQDAELMSSAMDQNDPLHGLRIESYRSEEIEADIIRGQEYIDPKILNVKAGQLIKSI